MDNHLHCKECGVAGQANCSCNKPYIYMSAADAAKRCIAAHPDWNDLRISEECGVSRVTVLRVRKSVCTNEQTEKKLGKDGKPYPTTKKRKAPQQEKAQSAVDERVKDGKSVPRKKIAEETGTTQYAVQAATIKARAREELLEELKANPEITRDMLPKTAQEKLDAGLRQYQKKLDAEFETRVQTEIQRRVAAYVMPAFEEERADADRVLKARKGIFNQTEYNAILRCLHPDMNPDGRQKSEAFQLWHERKLVLLSDKDDPRTYSRLPTAEELMRR